MHQHGSRLEAAEGGDWCILHWALLASLRLGGLWRLESGAWTGCVIEVSSNWQPLLNADAAVLPVQRSEEGCFL